MNKIPDLPDDLDIPPIEEVLENIETPPIDLPELRPRSDESDAFKNVPKVPSDLGLEIMGTEGGNGLRCLSISLIFLFVLMVACGLIALGVNAILGQQGIREFFDELSLPEGRDALDLYTVVPHGTEVVKTTSDPSLLLHGLSGRDKSVTVTQAPFSVDNGNSVFIKATEASLSNLSAAMREVVFPIQSLPQGTLLEADFLIRLPMLEADILDGMVFDIEDLVGKSTQVDLHCGQPLFTSLVMDAPADALAPIKRIECAYEIADESSPRTDIVIVKNLVQSDEGIEGSALMTVMIPDVYIQSRGSVFNSIEEVNGKEALMDLLPGYIVFDWAIE
ncbi:hypothetical protein MASR2M15_05760 [Anaerolineales bacterium]